MIERTSPDSGTTTYRYDPAGNLTGKTDARGATIDYPYDALNRPTQAKLAVDNQSQQYRWNYDGQVPDGQAPDSQNNFDYGQAIGRLSALTYPDHQEQYRSNAYGQLSRILRQHNNAVDTDFNLTYNNVGHLSGWQLDGLNVSRSTDALGCLTGLSIELNGQTHHLVDQIRHLPFEQRPIQIDFSHGLSYRATYDRYNGELISQQLQQSQDKPLQQQQYRVLPGIGISDIQDLLNSSDDEENKNNSHYQYDPQGRLIKADTALGHFSYVYDANGNRLQSAEQLNSAANQDSKKDRNNSKTLTDYRYHSGSNRLSQINDDNIELDAAGYPQNNAHFNLHYNADGHIQRVTQTNSANNNANSNNEQLIASYQYNPRRERIQKTLANGRSERYFYGLNQELLKRERYGTNNQLIDTRYYLWLDHTPLAVIDLKAGSNTPSITHIHSDHLGTPRAASNSAGQIIWQWHSDPFGNTQPNQDPDGDGNAFELNLRFPGQYYDQETGLHYNLNRYYNPATGRYLEADPIGLDGGWNVYGYANQNPLDFSDPLGFASVGALIRLPVLGAQAGASVGGPVGAAVGLVAGGLAAAAALLLPGDTPAAGQSAVPYPERKRGKYTCICRANKDGRSRDNCSNNNQDSALGYGIGDTLSQAKKMAEKNAKDKLGARSTHHIQCRCRSPRGDKMIPHG